MFERLNFNRCVNASIDTIDASIDAFTQTHLGNMPHSKCMYTSYMYLCTYMCIYLYAPMYVHMYIYTHTSMCVHMIPFRCKPERVPAAPL